MKTSSKNSREDVRVFVSRAAADREPARKLSDAMARRHGVRVFDPAEMLSAGGDWQARLKDELAGSDVFVALMSPEALKSSFVLQEIGAAWALDKPVVLVLKNVSERAGLLENWSDQFMVNLDDLDDPEVMSQLLRRHREDAELNAKA
ncbi:MAG: hypothetical protein BRD46_00615 [Bacteroidetes bacterium QS_8_68_15]|nr:MAG: hypothetical protein BRD46_00615 [Bacteroidetes bacterium QS_8_68_15]